MTRFAKVGLLALVAAAATIWLLPSASIGRGAELDRLDKSLRDTTQRVGSGVDKLVDPVQQKLRSAGAKTKQALARSKRAAASTRQTTSEPLTHPPLHGTNPHGQGGVAVVDVDPSNERPLGASPSGSDSGEEVVVGRARGEQMASGAYRGHITIAALFGRELAGVDTDEGETQNGPLQPIQEGILDPLCTGTSGQVCLSVLTANSVTTANGSSNDFALARAQLLGLGVGAAESGGAIGESGACQTAGGIARTANVASRTGAIAQVANSSTQSTSCRGAAPQTTASSQVIGLGGTQIPLPSPGCATGTPDTVTGLPPLLPIVCNAADVAGAAIVREALDVFVLNAGGTSLLKETTAASEAVSAAPEAGPQCSDGVDNDGDGLIDAADPGCHTDGNPNNPASYNPADTSEADAPTGGAGDRGPRDRPECSDNRDNDGDGLVDERDPGCHFDGNPNNPASYDRDDDSEENAAGVGRDGGGPAAAAGGARRLDADRLPFTGGDVVGLALAGLLVLAGGLLLRRREGAQGA